MTMNRSIGRAMTIAVDRVNLDNLDDIRRQLTDALAQVETLTRENRKLREQLDRSLPVSNQGYVETPNGKYFNGRPVFDLTDAPMKTGLNYFQCYRRLKDPNGWQGVKHDNGRWLIYDDQPLTAASRRKKARR